MTDPDAEQRQVRHAEQIPTGVIGLDDLLQGGLRRSGLHVIVGRPGAGKSVLAHQIASHRIREGGKVLYLTALVETHQTLIRQARTFRFFDPGTLSHSLYYASLYPTLAEGKLPGARNEISRLIAEHDPSLLVIDGLHALKLSAQFPLEYQQFMHEMEAQAAVSKMTTLLLTHPQRGMAVDPTFTIADGIFHLRTRKILLRSVRTLEVRKLRGVGHIDGEHTFTITSDGIRVHPRLEALVKAAHRLSGTELPPRSEEPLLGFQAEGFTEMIGGGVDPGSVTLMVGTPGSGKTLLCLAFLAAGAERGEPGLLFGFHETPERLLGKADGVGLPIREAVEAGAVHLAWQAPSELLADEIVQEVLALVDEHGIRRLVIDSTDELRRAALPGGRELAFLSALTDVLRERGLAVITTQNVARIVGTNFDLPMAEISPIMDNLLHTRTVELRSGLQRLVSVLKMRARGYDPSIRELHITGDGLRVGEAFDRSELLLTGLGWPLRGQEK
jgi:circadian clock protein KaiC